MVCEVSVRHVDFFFWFICSSDEIGLYAARTFKEVSYLLRRSFVRSSLPRDLHGCSWYDNLAMGTLCYQVTSVDCLTPSSRVNFFWVSKIAEYEVTERYALSEKKSGGRGFMLLPQQLVCMGVLECLEGEVSETQVNDLAEAIWPVVRFNWFCA